MQPAVRGVRKKSVAEQLRVDVAHRGIAQQARGAHIAIPHGGRREHRERRRGASLMGHMLPLSRSAAPPQKHAPLPHHEHHAVYDLEEAKVIAA